MNISTFEMLQDFKSHLDRCMTELSNGVENPNDYNISITVKGRTVVIDSSADGYANIEHVIDEEINWLREKNVINKYTTYDEKQDITTIWRQTEKMNGDVKSLEIVGFYFGKPNDEVTEEYVGKMKADF